MSEDVNLAELKWLGPEVFAEIQAATLLAIDATTAATANEARNDHWWIARHGEKGLEGQIRTRKARLRGGGTYASGKVGITTKRGFYGLFLERRHSFIRRAADKTFPMLGAAIRARTELLP